jgi:hypothetical protein
MEESTRLTVGLLSEEQLEPCSHDKSLLGEKFIRNFFEHTDTPLEGFTDSVLFGARTRSSGPGS